MPLIRTHMYNHRKITLRGLLYHHRKIAFEKAAVMYVKECLWLGLICMTLEKMPLRELRCNSGNYL